MNKLLNVITPFNVSSIENIVSSGSYSTPGSKLGEEGDEPSQSLLPKKVLHGTEEGIQTKTKIIKVKSPKLKKPKSTAKTKASSSLLLKSLHDAEEGAALRSRRGIEEYYELLTEEITEAASLSEKLSPVFQI